MPGLPTYAPLDGESAWASDQGMTPQHMYSYSSAMRSLAPEEAAVHFSGHQSLSRGPREFPVSNPL